MENDELIRRAEDLCRRCEKTASVTHTAFLTPAEQFALEAWAKSAPDCKILLCGGNEGCERRINDIFSAIEQLMTPSRELVPFVSPNTMTMSLKSSLEYKYRPTVKYEVELYRGDSDSLGELTVIFRTQSAALIRSMTEFFRIWKSIEDAHLRPVMEQEPPKYALYDGKFIRSISVPAHDCSSDELAKVISEYIKLFDTMMKGYLSGRLNARDIEACYFSQLRRADILI